MTKAPDESGERLRAWLKELVAKSGMSATALAKAAGLSHTTLSRAMQPDYRPNFRADTIAKLALAAGVAPPTDLHGQAAMPILGFAEDELELIADNGDDPNVSQWIIRTDLLMLAGFLPGDRIEFSANKVPRANDVVMAQVVDYETGTAETVMRIYRPPFLFTRSAGQREPAPLMVDNDRVKIVATWTRMWRNPA